MKIVSEIMLILSNYILLAYTGQGSLQKPPPKCKSQSVVSKFVQVNIICNIIFRIGAGVFKRAGAFIRINTVLLIVTVLNHHHHHPIFD